MEILCEVKSDDKWMNQQKKKKNHSFFAALLRKRRRWKYAFVPFNCPKKLLKLTAKIAEARKKNHRTINLTEKKKRDV